MSVNPKDKEALQEMWSKAQHASSSDIPDGTYQFVILAARFHMASTGRPQFKIKVRIKGGAEEYVGKEFEINDNLETPENMGWFKKKLSRLNLVCPEDFDEIVDGTLAEQMVGKVFEGQAKTKNDFLNVYVNRLLGEETASKDTEEEPVSEHTETDADAYEEGQAVAWNGKVGEIVELCDDGKYRVRAGDGKVYRVDKTLLKPVAGEESEAETETTEDTDTDDGVTLPTAEEVEGMPAAEIKKTLGAVGIDASGVKNPRAVLHGIATLAEDPKGKIELTEIAPLAAALNVQIKKGTMPKEATKALSVAVQELIGGA